MSITFAEKLRTLRRELHLEQGDVAQCLGVDRQKIGRFETGAQEPKVSEVCALLATFMTTFEREFTHEVELAMADVAARLEGYLSSLVGSSVHPKRLKTLERLKVFLNQPHGGAF